MEYVSMVNLESKFDNAKVEDKWYKIWMDKGYFHADSNSDKKPYSIVIPPPNITGSLHMGHALNNTLQDILVRFKRMDGFNTLWMPGTDHAGIATQNVVERQLMAEGTDRHEFGREQFIDRVWKWKEESGGTITKQLMKLGSSCDWERERFTMDEGLSKAVRKVFVSLYEEGLIYRGPYIINWCPRCLTALSDLEVEHEDVNGHFYHIKYPVKPKKNKDGKNGKKVMSSFLTVATTRPETMFGDTAVAVHPDDERYSDYIGGTVILPVLNKEIPIIADKYVDREFGTGSLKVTPAHDPNDFELGKRHKLAEVKVMDDHGVMNENAGEFQGMDRFECRKKLVKKLRTAGTLINIEDIVHSVGHCYRCKTVVEPALSTQWFVKMKPLAKDAIKVVEEGKVKIVPETWKNTYYEWMNNIRDWCISRQIWWGHRIPVWYCEDCDEQIVANEDPDKCTKCNSKNLRQDTDVLDTWFSSSLWPFSTLGWPEKTPELKQFYPTSTLVTGFDILFFWIARMIVMGLKFMDEVPFKNVYIHALVRDAEGKKMSKSKGNVIDPLIIIKKYGTDAFRFTLASLAAQGRDIKLSEERIDGYRHFSNKIWNASRFALLNMNGHIGIAPEKKELTIVERWILSRLNKTILNVREALDSFKFNEAANIMYQFVWHELCDWYIELIKKRLLSEDDSKQVAQHVLCTTLENSLRLLHPFMPFITEEIWQLLPHEGESIMVAKFPQYDPEMIDEGAEKDVGVIMELLSGIRNIRGEMNISPAKKLDVIVNISDKYKLSLLKKESHYIIELDRLNSLEIGKSFERPENSATSIVSDMEIYIPLKGVLNLEEEKRRLTKEFEKVQKELEAINKKLSNREFTERAPKEVVQKNENRQNELLEKETKLKFNMQVILDG